MVLFSEDHIQETKRRGRIEVICGSMFSGKTEELIRRMKRAKFARQRVEIFKPAIDTRYSEEDVVSHDSHSIASTPIDSSASILLFTSEIDVVGIDEAQFFDSGLIDICNQLANNGVRVIIAGLDMDFKGNPFGPMPQLCAIADEVSKVHAICVKCGQLASFSHRTVKNDKQVLLGETAEYEPLCRECYLRALKDNYIYGKEKNNIRQFYTWCHRMCIGGRNINAGGTTERSVIALLYCVADRLHGLSAGQILPIQAEVEKSYRLYPLCIIPDYSCRSILILSVSTANDFGNQQNE